MPWWLDKSMRLIQTNLNEKEIDLDPERFVAELVDFSANVVLFNVGGIVANYDTALEYHYRNPYLRPERGDILQEVIDRCHKAGIRFMARFDFSKLNETLAARRPEWLYVSEAGNHNNYNGQVQTCVSGGYQQDYCLKILGEVIERYDIDSVFFNMNGYQRQDYDRNYLGICQCDACRRAFRDHTGLELPPTADVSNPAYLPLERFALEHENEQYDRINRHVKRLNPEIAVCTYTSRGIDIWRKESATTFERDLEWNYESSENVKSVLPVYPDKTVSNAAVHFVSRRFRYSAVAPELTQLRLAQSIANAAPLDFFVMGTLGGQKDRVSYDGVRGLFRFQKENAGWFEGVEQLADICLVNPEVNYVYGARDEYYGLMRILAENHVLHDIWSETELETAAALEVFSRYGAVILPDARCLQPATVTALDAYVQDGGVVIATGQTATLDVDGSPTGRCMLASSGIRAIREIRKKANSGYFAVRPEDKAVLGGFEGLDVVFLYSDYMICDPDRGAVLLMNFIPPHMHGPPEKCYYEVETDDPGAICNRFGAGHCITVPWGIGAQYQTHGNHAHSILIERLLARFCPAPRIRTSASKLVEINAQRQRAERWMLVSLVNHSGQNGHAYHPPVPMTGIDLEIETPFPVGAASTLVAGEKLEYRKSGDGIALTLPRLDRFETIVLQA